METAPALQRADLAPQQAQKRVTVTESLCWPDALVQRTVASRTTTAESATPAEGEARTLPAGKTAAPPALLIETQGQRVKALEGRSKA